MKRQTSIWISLTLFVLCAAVSALPQTATSRRFESYNSTTFYLTVRAGACDVLDPAIGLVTSATPADALMYGAPPARPCNPVTAPDGHHMTLAEFNAIEGTVSVRCLGKRTLVSVQLTGLQPGGVYTVWVPINVAPPPIASTALGSVVGYTTFVNSFTASDTGTGQIALMQPPGIGTNVAGVVPACLLGDPNNRVEVHIVYHLDGNTNGPTPGPPITWVVEERFQLFLP